MTRTHYRRRWKDYSDDNDDEDGDGTEGDDEAEFETLENANVYGEEEEEMEEWRGWAEQSRLYNVERPRPNQGRRGRCGDAVQNHDRSRGVRHGSAHSCSIKKRRRQKMSAAAVAAARRSTVSSIEMGGALRSALKSKSAPRRFGGTSGKRVSFSQNETQIRYFRKEEPPCVVGDTVPFHPQEQLSF